MNQRRLVRSTYGFAFPIQGKFKEFSLFLVRVLSYWRTKPDTVQKSAYPISRVLVLSNYFRQLDEFGCWQAQKESIQTLAELRIEIDIFPDFTWLNIYQRQYVYAEL